MESDGAITLFQRLENNRNLIYGTYIGDGDSKAYSSVKNCMSYGLLVYINKEECWAHITKRMGTGLETIVENYKGMFCWSSFFSHLCVLKFSNKLILLEFQIMEVISQREILLTALLSIYLS